MAWEGCQLYQRTLVSLGTAPRSLKRQKKRKVCPEMTSGTPRDAELRQIETQIRQAIRDAVNRNSRKPFYWGGLAGYQQLEAIAEALHGITEQSEESAYLLQLSRHVDRTLEKNQEQAQDLQEAHTWLRWIADGLHYPLGARQEQGSLGVWSSAEKSSPLSSTQIAQNMEHCSNGFSQMQEFTPSRRDWLWRFANAGSGMARNSCTAMTSLDCHPII